MEYSFYDFLKLLGSLALFLYGMKIMSEGLQKFAGDRLRKILTAMTTNRVTGVLTGVLITALVQSSSATTVMVVSFVNAGLLTLSQSIGVIMGANIGTTVTAWIISALGFKVDIAAFALPLLAFGIPLLFSQKSNRKSVGEFIFGFSFLFMGLSYLKNNAPDLSQNPDMLSFVQDYTDMGFISILLFVGIGTVLTMIVQASAATMAITLIMCANGWISFELGAALVLGENIGTTITANLAALTGNTQARRAALAHLVFNVFGVIWVLCLFTPFTEAVSWFVENVMGTKDPAGRILQAFGIPYLLQYLQRADIDMVREVYRTYGLCHYSNEGAGRGISLAFYLGRYAFYGRAVHPAGKQGNTSFCRTYPPYVRNGAGLAAYGEG